MIPTKLPHALDAAADLLHQIHAVKHTKQERIARDTLQPDIFFLHPGRQASRADNFHPITIHVYLNIGIRAPMGVKSLSLTNKTEKAFVNDKDLTPWIDFADEANFVFFHDFFDA